MPNFKHILFPVDFSERCCGALPFVEGMAGRYGAKVTLLNVPSAHYSAGLASAEADAEDAFVVAEERLRTSFHGNFKHLRVDRITELGDPAAVIADFARNSFVDLIMMPTHGYGPFRRLLLGSVTAKVLHDVEVPVWTTAHTGLTPDRAHLPMQKIMCAVDGSPASVPLLQWAANLSNELGSSLRVVHAVPGIESWPERQMDVEFGEEIRKSARRLVEDREAEAGIDAPFCITLGNVSDAVAEEAERHGADLLVIGRGVMQNTMGRLRTHAHSIIRLAPCPVLSV